MAKPWQSDQAIIVVNLGSPEAPTEKAVRRYLREFLMDRHVLNLPFLLRWLLVNLVIAPFRAKRSAQAYCKIWTDEGSPLIAITERFVAELAKHTDAPVYAAMRYGSPQRKIPAVMEQVCRAGFKKVFVVPLYPHYAQATTGTVFAQAERTARKLDLELKFLPRFYWYSAYLDLLAEKVKEMASTHDFVLFSYHGLPESHIRKTDKFGYCLR
ncbi:MAG: ferrochelatase, partial [Leptospiraceae bacterium]|nr:ferrochelatase [Leptospiraceae bacterium]